MTRLFPILAGCEPSLLSRRGGEFGALVFGDYSGEGPQGKGRDNVEQKEGHAESRQTRAHSFPPTTQNLSVFHWEISGYSNMRPSIQLKIKLPTDEDEAVENFLMEEAAMDAAAMDAAAMDAAAMDAAAMDAAASSARLGVADGSAAAATAPARASDRIRVWVVRHAERADEQGAEVRMMRQRSAESKCGSKIHRADPLLTLNGLQQARVAGKLLKAKLKGHKVDIFTSPLLRCAQTASIICEELQHGEDMAVHPISGLGSCALAIKNRGLPYAIENIFQSSPSISSVCDGRVRMSVRDDRIDANFITCMDRLARNAMGKGTLTGNSSGTDPDMGASADSRSDLLTPTRLNNDIICVTHREAFYGNFFKQTRARLPYKPPYCCIGEFTYDGHSWELVDFDVGYSISRSEGSTEKINGNNRFQKNMSRRRSRLRRCVHERIGDGDVIAACAAVSAFGSEDGEQESSN
eukprot:g3950.t1